MIEQYQRGDDPLLAAPRPYALSLKHKHVPEMQLHTGMQGKPLFVPIVANFYKGLAVTVPLHFSQLAPGSSGDTLVRAFARHYEGERFIRVMGLSDPAVLESEHDPALGPGRGQLANVVGGVFGIAINPSKHFLHLAVRVSRDIQTGSAGRPPLFHDQRGDKFTASAISCPGANSCADPIDV